MALKSTLIAMCIIASMIMECSATRTDPLRDEMWMLFARHPDKGLKGDAWLSKKGVKELKYILERAGAALKRRLRVTTASNQVTDPAYRMLGALLRQLPSNRIQFEASDLRRTQLEALALRMTMEKARIGDTSNKRGTIAGSSFQIVHNLAEIPKRLLGVQYNIASASHLLNKNIFVSGTGGSGSIPNTAEKKSAYWQYLATGFKKFFTLSAVE